MEASYIVVEKVGGIFWDGGVDSGSVANSCRKGGYIVGERGKYWERCIVVERGRHNLPPGV